MTIPFIIIMLLLALFIVYFNMSSRVRYLLWMLCLRLYSPILITFSFQKVWSGRWCREPGWTGSPVAGFEKGKKERFQRTL